MAPKVGQTIYAIDVCLMDTNEESLTIGKGYEVIYTNPNKIHVIDDDKETHAFLLDKNSIDYWGLFFTTEPPKKERYFIVFYESMQMTRQSFTSVGVTTRGAYPNKNSIPTTTTNIIELNQQDYESWNK